jgi:DNA invertase Pin-like site-specific DNA recombinase
MKAALYARTSTADQYPEAQLIALRDYCARRDWPIELEYVDDGISGAGKARPALDALTHDARRGRFEIVVAWRLDRLGRSLRSLVLLLDGLTEAGIAVASVDDGIDLSTAAGRFQVHILGALAEYERTMIGDRVRMGIARARRDGVKLGRPRLDVSVEQLAAAAGLSLSEAAESLRVSRSYVSKWRRQAAGGLSKKPPAEDDRKI